MNANLRAQKHEKDAPMRNAFVKTNDASVRSLKIRSAVLLFCTIGAAVFAVGCGSKFAPTPPPPSGGSESLAIFMKDAPSDSALSLQVTINSVSMANAGGQSVTLTNTPRTYELTHLSLAPTLTTLQNVSSGAYTGVTLTLSNPRMQILDPNGNLKMIDATSTPSITLAQSSVTVPISLSLSRQANGGVVLDFDISKSLTVDNQANFVLTPMLAATIANANDPTPQLTNCVGSVIALAKDGSGFDLQLAESGVTVHVVVDSNTFFDTAAQKLANVTAGEILEVTASLETDGTYLAKAINGSASSLNARQQGLFTGAYRNDSGQTVVSVAPQD